MSNAIALRDNHDGNRDDTTARRFFPLCVVSWWLPRFLRSLFPQTPDVVTICALSETILV